MNGKIQNIIKDKNFGFIQSEDNKKIFFHFSEIKFRGNVKRGMEVEFDYGQNKKGVTAINIVKRKHQKPKKWDNLISFIENAEIDEESRKILLRNLAQFRQQELHILIAGPTGVGKSSTINALFDTDVAVVGYGVDAQTTKIQEWKLDENLFLHDTPGLGDGAEKDLLYKQMIKDELNKKRSDGSAVIDVALVIIDGSHRDMGTSIDLINKTIIPNMEDKSRVLVAINQCDMADMGRGWNKKGNYPNKELVQRLNAKTESVQRRIKESTGVDIQPIYYSALYKYNISKLLSFIIKCTPVKKRFFYMSNLNNDEKNWKYNDRSTYNKCLLTKPQHEHKYENLSKELLGSSQPVRNFGKKYKGKVQNYDTELAPFPKYQDLSNEVAGLKEKVHELKRTYQQDTSDLQKSVTGMEKSYQQNISDLQKSVTGMEMAYQRNISDLQKSVAGMEIAYQQNASDVQKSVADMGITYQQSTSNLQKSVISIQKTYQQETAEMLAEALDEVSEEISKGSKTPIRFEFKQLIHNVSDGISTGAQEGESIGAVVPVIGKGLGRFVGGVVGAIGGLLKSVIQ